MKKKGGMFQEVRLWALIILCLTGAVLLWLYSEQVFSVLSDQILGSLILVAALIIDILLFAFLYAQSESSSKGAELSVSVQKLQQSEAQLAEIIRGVSIPVFVIDRSHTITYWNTACVSLTGLSAKEMIGTKRQWCAFYPAARPILADLVVDGVLDLDLYEPGSIERSSVEGAYIGRGFYPSVGKNGRWLEFTAAPLRGVNGEVIGAVETLIDITQIKESERMKTEFLSIAAHQLRTPLGAIRWTAEMLLNGDVGILPKAAKEMVGKQEEDVKHLIKLVGALLNVTRIEQGRVQDAPERVDLLAQTRHVLDELRPEARSHRVTLRLSSARLKHILYVIDPERFTQAIENLVSNAVKYNRQGGTIEVCMTKQKHAILISVKDSGIGVPKADQPHIFSKFFRATNATLNHTDGSGLGLFVVKSYVEGWGGTIAFESEEGVGSTFTITLPLRQRTHVSETTK